VITKINRDKLSHFSHCTEVDHTLSAARFPSPPSLSMQQRFLKEGLAVEHAHGEKKERKKVIKKGTGNSGNSNK